MKNYNWLIYKENKDIVARCNSKEYAEEIKKHLQEKTIEKLNIIYKEVNSLSIKI